MTRILVIVPFPMSDAERAQRAAQAKSVRLDPALELEFRSVRAAPANYTSEHDSVLAAISILDAGKHAQTEGFDAVCIDTMSDSGLAALRSLLDIPVIGPGRSSMLFALTLGERFSILMMWDRWRHLYQKTIAELNLDWRCASIRSIGVAPNNRTLLAGKEDDVFPRLLATATQCIEEDLAEVILLGSTTMHQAHTYLAARLPVPVINPGPLSYRLAETALALRLRHSRRAFPTPLVTKPQQIDAMLSAAASLEARR
jgi:allantoin racemase